MVWLFLPLILSHVSAQSFSVVVPLTSVSGLLGGSVTLPCALSDNLDVRKLEVRWYRPSMYSSPALLYQNEKLEPSADIKYQGRVSLPGPLEKGDVSLKLDDLRPSDIGTYMCHVSSDRWYDKNNVSLTIQAVGSSPILSLLDAGGGKVNVSCQSHGWLPKPSLTWRYSEGSSLKHLSDHTTTKDSEGLFSVSSWMLFTSSESSWVSCSVALPDSVGMMRESRVMPHLPTGYGIWMIAFFGTLILLLLFIIGVGVYCVVKQTGNKVKIHTPLHSNDSQTTEIQVQNRTELNSNESETTEDQVENHTLLNSNESQTTDWWQQVKRFKVRITIDPAETPEIFRITHRGTSVHCPKPKENYEEDKSKIFTLCEERFSSGQQYWELKVKQDYNEKRSWYVGVAADEAERINGIKFTPENGFWVLSYEEERGVYIRETRSPKIQDISDDLSVIGVFLDCDNHTLSFYNAETQSHIYTYTRVTPRTSLHPLISPGIRDIIPVHIC